MSTPPSAVSVQSDAFAAEVVAALQRTPRQLPAKYFYDALGSALFDAICRLPWYRITRAETALLSAHAPDILAPVSRPFTVAELGCGSGEKLALLVGGVEGCDGVHLIDISAAALAAARDRLALLGVPAVHCHEGAYETGLQRLAEARTPGTTLVVAFLGSNIGNFDPPAARALLASLRACLAPGDVLLLGTDLVKAPRELMLAYDDPLGVTAAFNLNLLRRINDELGGTFDLRAFRHRAVWNAAESRVEMHLVCERAQIVRIAHVGLEVRFAAGDWIWTESSYKYDPAAVVAEGRAVGFGDADQWVDGPARFALTRFRV